LEVFGPRNDGHPTLNVISVWNPGGRGSPRKYGRGRADLKGEEDSINLWAIPHGKPTIKGGGSAVFTWIDLVQKEKH